MTDTNDVKLKKRPGESGRGQQVWVAWKYSTARERTYAIEELKRTANQPKVHTALARDSDHPTSKSAAKSLSPEGITHLEAQVYQAILRSEREGLIWDEAERILHLRPGSISPRWKPLRKERLILAALEEET